MSTPSTTSTTPCSSASDAATSFPRARGGLLVVPDGFPYCSWYLTGFVMDKPLAVLRADLAALGFERRDDVKEPEDHAAALLETMALLAASAEHGVDVQRRFFDRHVATWMGTFFADLQSAESARFYRAVGRFGDRFMKFETQYLSIVI